MHRYCRTNAPVWRNVPAWVWPATGGGNEDHSGDIFIAFATGNQHVPPAAYEAKTHRPRAT